ncbi:MAG: hypothetical protein LUG96_06860 [Tannerellaceae bacterium]|nr:hypothetical protein [Tannerellaceae bacterium]
MKRYLSYMALMVFLFGTTSCSKYYYSTVSSNAPEVLRNEMGDFVEEDDSVSIVYSFFGEDLPIHITVYNKTDQPMFVDWRQSALIVEDEAANYISNDMQVRGGTYGKTYSYKDYLMPGAIGEETYGEYDDDLCIPAYVTFIPPQSRIGHVPITLANFSFDKIPNDKFTKQSLAVSLVDTKVVKMIHFEETNSPLRFRSYLSLYTVGPDGKRNQTFRYQQRFYLSRLVKAGGLSPNRIPDYTAQRGDFFYIRNVKGRNAGIWAGVIAICMAGVVIEAAVGGGYYYY